jgi:hypothetical protein
VRLQHHLNELLAYWDVLSVRSMFERATYFHQPLGNWNVLSVVDMSGRFLGATSFNESLAGWDVSCVTDMDNTSFNQQIGNRSVSPVDNMRSMLEGARFSISPLEIGTWCECTVRRLHV